MNLRARAPDALEALKRRPWVATVLELHRRQEADGVGHLAAAVTYYLFLSVLPAMMLALSKKICAIAARSSGVRGD